jgi:hypothetical protein
MAVWHESGEALDLGPDKPRLWRPWRSGISRGVTGILSCLDNCGVTEALPRLFEAPLSNNQSSCKRRWHVKAVKACGVRHRAALRPALVHLGSTTPRWASLTLTKPRLVITTCMTT